jgi:glycosyltransferase involved in cell wall biosynthesis
MMDNIGIIIACYNGASFLRSTLDSVLAQTYSMWSCIIVDDGSSDRTAEIAEAYAATDSRFHVLRQANGGVSAARNAGLTHLSPTARWVVFLDQDDVWRPHALARLLEAAQAASGCTGSHALGDMIDAEGRPLAPGEFARFGRERYGFRNGRIVAWPVTEPTTFAVLANCFTIYPPGLALIRRSSLERANGFDPRYTSGGEDWDLFARLSRSGPIEFVDDVVIDYRRHESNGTNDIARMHALAAGVRRSILSSSANNPEQAKLARSACRAWHRKRLVEKWRAGAAGPRGTARWAMHLAGHWLLSLIGKHF